RAALPRRLRRPRGDSAPAALARQRHAADRKPAASPQRRPDRTRPHPVRIVFTTNGWEDYTYWLSADRTTLKRINRLIDAALRDPTTGIGKPEPLRHMFAGCWSRRISEEHRLVYLIDGEDLVILQARYHYK